MPHLVQMDKRHGSSGLQVIGLHFQEADEKEIKKTIKKLKIEFPVAEGGSQPVKTDGIPHLFVFDTQGKLVFSGHPSDKEAEKTIKRELTKVSVSTLPGKPGAPKPAMIATRDWTNSEGKTIKAEVLSIQGEEVEFRLANGKTSLFPIAKLSEDDQKFLKENAAGETEEKSEN